MAEQVYDNQLMGRAVSTASLETRLDMNKKFQSTDFDSWLMARLNPQAGEDILDVGCGTGAQSIPFLKSVGPEGSVSALDIAADSVAELIRKSGNSPCLSAAVSDMGKLADVIDQQFAVKQYDLAQSSYALYYSAERMAVLDTMRKHLKPNGRLAVFTPNAPHGMVEFVRQFAEIPGGVDDCMEFGPHVLEPYFRKHFWDVTVHFFHNVVRIPTVADFASFYRSTTYYNASVEQQLSAVVENKITENGFFEYEKNGYLIIGQSQF